MGDRRKYIVIILLLISGLVNNYFYTRGARAVEPGLPITIPFVKAGWQGTPYLLSDGITREDEISREYRFNNGMPMNLLVLLKNAFHDPRICYGGLGWQLTDTPFLSTSSGKVMMVGLRGRMKNEEIMIYYGFLIGARVIPDGIKRKYYESLQRLTYGYERQVFIEVTMVVPRGEIKIAEAYLRKFLEDMEENLIISQS
ncbi:MAG: exosortase-associated EpsI family protein [Deltaproteobacteria bacterium]|nr:exosortase-associated EpsI family protein [Deltaproteobacteria bacterium]